VVHPEHGGRDIHIAFSVDDVEPVRAALEAAGVKYSMSKSGRAALFCRDPDGNALEFSAVK
jgi:glyoxylase I family protein